MLRSILAYNFTPERLQMLKMVALLCKAQVKAVAREDMLQPVGYMAGVKGIEPVEEKYVGDEATEEMIFLCGFGYAKPVSVNPRNFKDPKKGMAITAIAGPTSNLIMGFFFVFLTVLVQNVFYKANLMIVYPVISFLYFAAAINVNLAVFNLLPIPPLDGSRILQLLIPAKYYYKFLQYERYVVIVVFILILSGVLSTPLSIISSLFLDLFTSIAELPFTLF